MGPLPLLPFRTNVAAAVVSLQLQPRCPTAHSLPLTCLSAAEGSDGLRHGDLRARACS